MFACLLAEFFYFLKHYCDTNAFHSINSRNRLVKTFVEHSMGQSRKIAIEIVAQLEQLLLYGQVLAMAWKQTNIYLSIEKPLQWRHKKKWP